MKVIQYVPHGAVPDIRGFAPAIIGQNLAKHMKFAKPYIISNFEHYKSDYEHSRFGDVYRIGESAVYRALFKKMTRLDPYPLHRKAAVLSNMLGIDIFHAHQTEFPVKDFLAACSRKPKVVVQVNAMRNFEPVKNGVPDLYLAASEYTKKRMLEERRYPEDIVGVLYNGFDEELFYKPSPAEKNSLKSILGIPQNSIVVGYIGRKQQVKGFYNFLRCVKYLREIGIEIFALSVGPTPWDTVRDENYDDEQKLLAELKNKEWFFDMDPLPHDRLCNVYKAIDVLLFPTYFGGEQHPIVAVEGIAAGCVVISSNKFSIPETIEHGISGILLEDPKNIDELIEVTRRVVLNINSFECIQLAAANSAKAKFSWNSLTAELEKVYFKKLN
ncbi:MAG: glycosyltransferase family 4 protein [Campylobacteraceae bacterium]|jgi:UDP-glucose:(glucosyl)LPS alpha-1,2-glucosyltransferase/UDP-N-acetylglucosamine:(glucosyl)LPS alpha-1,2-N-acetylglucosaminyltransferase|nr:glycosyltransferase family 4 protein [Campylobacteraceae bacterium]